MQRLLWMRKINWSLPRPLPRLLNPTHHLPRSPLQPFLHFLQSRSSKGCVFDKWKSMICLMVSFSCALSSPLLRFWFRLVGSSFLPFMKSFFFLFSLVWKLGDTLYEEKKWPNLYRTWDCFAGQSEDCCCLCFLWRWDKKWRHQGETESECVATWLWGRVRRKGEQSTGGNWSSISRWLSHLKISAGWRIRTTVNDNQPEGQIALRWTLQLNQNAKTAPSFHFNAIFHLTSLCSKKKMYPCRSFSEFGPRTYYWYRSVTRWSS